MTECPECGGTIDTAEDSCPHCGVELLEDEECDR